MTNNNVLLIQELGPVILTKTSSAYDGNVSLTLESNRLVTRWDLGQLTDVEPDYLKFSVALGMLFNKKTILSGLFKIVI